MKHLNIVMIGTPKGPELIELRKTGRALGVPVSNLEVPTDRIDDWHDLPVYALETWRGPKTHNLSTFQFPERMTLITGTTNRGLDPEWRDVIEGSIYIDQSNWAETFLSVPAAGAMVMWEFHKQRGV